MDENSNSDISKMGANFELELLKKQIKELEKKNIELKRIIEANDIELDEDECSISDEEYICITQITKLKQLSDNCIFTKDEASILDILHKNLKIARGQSSFDQKGRKKKLSIKELNNIVELHDTKKESK